MFPRSNKYHWKNIEPLVAFLLVAGVLAIMIPVVQAYGDRNQVCAQNLHYVARAVNGYVQDYDECFPPASIWNDPARFKVAVNPYLYSTSSFTCPATKSPLYARNPALAGQSPQNFDGDTVQMLEDAVAHPDGIKTIAFVDGHVERNGVEQFFPDAKAGCAQHLQGIAMALQAYAQDYDERLPFQTNDSQLRAALYPYTKTNRFWNCPVTGTPFAISQTIRGQILSDFPDYSQIVVASDAHPHKDGVVTTAYLNGYVIQSGPRGTDTYIPGNSSPATADQISISKVKALSLALLQYTQDYDGVLPPMSNIDSLYPLLMPYTKDSSLFVPPIAGGTPFVLNTSLSQQPLSNYPSPIKIIWIKDTNNYGNSFITAGYLDGHVRRITP